MASVSKQSKKENKKENKKESKKESKKETTFEEVLKAEQSEIEQSEIEQSDMEEEEKHSLFLSEIKSDIKIAKFYRKLHESHSRVFYDNDGALKVLCHDTGCKSEDELDKLFKEINKTHNNKEKKQKNTFTPTNLVKPKKPIDIFGEVFSKESKEKGIKFSKDNNYLTCKVKAWKELSEKEQEKYIKESKKQNDKFNLDEAKQKSEAIKNGEFPEDEIKRPLSAYFLFLADKRQSLNDLFKNESDIITKIAKKGGEMWKDLKLNDKKTFDKYNEKAKVLKDEYIIKKAEWDLKETERRKKQAGNPNDIQVESSGQQKVEKTKTKSKNDNKKKIEQEVITDAEDFYEAEEDLEIDNSEAEESNAEIEEEVKVETKKSQKKASIKKDKAELVKEEVKDVKKSKKTSSKSKD